MSAVDLPDHLLYWQSIWKKPRRGRDKLNPRKSITNLNPLKKGSLSSLRRGSVTPSIRNEPLAGTGGLMGLPNLGASLAGEQAASASPLTHRGGHEYKSEAGPDPRADGHSRGYSKEKFNFIEEFFICLACIFDWAVAVYYCCSRQVAPPSQTAKDIQQSFSTHINLYFFAYLLEHKNMFQVSRFLPKSWREKEKSEFFENVKQDQKSLNENRIKCVNPRSNKQFPLVKRIISLGQHIF